MPRLNRISFAMAALLISGLASAQGQDLSKVEIRTEKLADNVYVLFGSGGNIGLLTGEDGAVVIDDQFAPLTDKIMAAIARVSPKPARFVLNTHWHFDHTGGNENFGKAGAVIVAHDNTLKRMSTKQAIEQIGQAFEPSPKAALPIVTFTESVSLHLNGEDIDAIHVPHAHTDSDVIMYFKKANVLHMGDVFPGLAYPFVDRGSGGSLEGIIAATRKVLDHINANTKIIPGHAPVATRADLESYHKMLTTVRDRIVQGIKEGKTQEQVLASQPSKEFDAKFGTGFIKPDVFLQGAYVELRRAAGP